MKFDAIVQTFGNKPWFDFEMVHLISGEAAPCVHTELYRWRESGKLTELRRGMFTLAEPWRRRVVEGEALAAALAGPIYPPSYLSGLWVLARNGMAPACDEFTSVTARPARVFENAFGRFSYQNLPRDLLFGSKTELIGGCPVRMAEPEKALLDYWFIEGGKLDEERFEAVGLDPRPLDLERLGELATRTSRPRLTRAAKAFMRYAERKKAAL
ncbi:MAG: hypothetical protein NT061_06190 [Spirochaetes bacterium]|nr:hypothetical protein [Spirochaetota bacterium]